MSDARRLLVITYHFGPHGPVGGLRWWGIAKYLVRLGWKVSVVTAAPDAGNEAPRGVEVEWCPRLWTLLDGCRLLRGPVLGRSLEGLPPASRAVPRSGVTSALRKVRREVTAFLAFPDESRGWMIRAALHTRSVIRRFQPQVIVSSGPPHSAHFVAGLATIRSSARWWIDLRDPWAGPLPEQWQSHPRLGSSVFRALAPRFERFVVRAAHGIITTTRQLAEALAAKYPDVPIACVPNGVDPAGLPRQAAHRYPGLGIAYAGTLYAGRDVGPVVQALRIFFERHPEAAQAGSRLRIAGGADGDYARALYDAVARNGMERYVEVLGPLPRTQALELVSRSRLAVVLAQDQELQIPAKLYESVAMGIPTLVVAPAGSATGVEGNRIGAAVRDARDVEGIACVLEQVWRDGYPMRPPSPAQITYESIAPVVDNLLGISKEPTAGRTRGTLEVAQQPAVLAPHSDGPPQRVGLSGGE